MPSTDQSGGAIAPPHPPIFFFFSPAAGVPARHFVLPIPAAESMPTLASQDLLTGQRVRIWWPDEAAFFSGTVQSYHTVVRITPGVAAGGGAAESCRKLPKAAQSCPKLPIAAESSQQI